YYDLDAVAARELTGGGEAIGKYAQRRVPSQRAGHRLGGGADINKDTSAIGHEPGCGDADGELSLDGEFLLLCVTEPNHGRVCSCSAPVKALKHAAFVKANNVAPDGL